MSKQGDAAYAWFLKGYNCSQSVVAAFAPQLGLTEEMALRLSAGFGAGIGRMREVCGAFCGVVTVLSMVYADPTDPKDKSRMYTLVQEAAEQYRSRNGGSIICRELLAKDGTELYRTLQQVDPTAAAEIHPNNKNRVVRALELYYAGITKTAQNAILSHAKRRVRGQNLCQMVHRCLPLRCRRRRSGNGHTGIDLHRVGTHNLAVQPPSQSNAQTGFAGGGGAGHHTYLCLHTHALPNCLSVSYRLTLIITGRPWGQ